MEGTIGKVDYLARSATRVKLLKALYERGPLEKSELKDCVDATRTTVQRNLDALAAEGWIRDDNCTYWITRSGMLLTEQFLALLDTLSVTEDFEPFLKWLPPNSFDLDLDALATADLTVADKSDPYAPVNRHVEFMRSAEEFQCILPAVGLQPMLVARDCIIERGHVHEIVLSEDVAETLASDRSYREPVADLVESDRCELVVSRRSVPFYLGLAGDTVQIGVGDDDEVPQSLVESTDPNVREWGEETYTEHRTDAEPFTTRWPLSRTA